jgi:hypothetical protein
MKALTLTQPWASLMAAQREPGIAWKRIETRSWYTGYRGELVIHAAKNFPADCRDFTRSSAVRKALGDIDPKELPISVGVCVVRLLACIKTTELHKAEQVVGCKLPVEELLFGNYDENRYAWLTEYVRPLPNIGPVKGALGLWEWPEVSQ